MVLKPVDTAIIMVVGPCIDDTDFKSLEEAIAYNAAGMDISLIIEKTDGTSTTTAITLTTGGTSDWTHKDGGYYEVEVTAAQNAEEGIAYLRGVCTGVLPFESPKYEIVKGLIYDSLIKGTDTLRVDMIQIQGLAQSVADLRDFADNGYDPATHKINGVKLVDTTTTNTDMVGTDSAYTGTPPTVVQIREEMDTNSVDLNSILGDTNELQLNQGNWLTAVGFSTHAAADIWSVGTRALTDKVGFSLSTAGVNLIWDDLISGMTAVGSIGKLIADNLNATITSRAVPNEYDTQMGYIPSDLGSVPIASELNSAHGAGSWATATGFSTHSAANVWSVATRILTANTNFNDLSTSDVNTEVANALTAIKLDHLINIAVDTNWATTVHLDSVIGQLTDVGTTATFDRTTDSQEAIRNRGDSAWVTGGGGAINDILNIQTLIPYSIDLADTANIRIGLGLTNMVDDLPTTAEITPGTITIDRKAIGGTSWINKVNAIACSELTGLIYYDEVFDTATGYAAGDSIRITFKSQKITVDANDFEITGADGWVFQTHIREAMIGTTGANITTPPTVIEIRTEMDDNSTKMAPSQTLADYKATGFSTHSAANVWSVISRSLTDKSGFSLSTVGIKAMWDQLTSALTTVGSAGKLLVDNVNATISSRSSANEYDTEMARIDATISSRNSVEPNTVIPDVAGTAATLHGITDGKIDIMDAIVDSIKAKTDNLPSGITKNEALPKFDFLMVLSSDHVTGATGKTVTGEISKDGGAFTAITNTITEVSSGMYTIASGFTQTEMNADVITLKFDETDCDTRIITLLTN